MKSFRVTKSKEQIEEQRKVEEHSLKELSEFFNLLITAKQEERPITEEQIVEHSEIIETITVPVAEEPLIVEPKSLVDVTAEQIKQSVKEAAFELPDAPKPAPEIKILQQKVQDITNWLSKITMTGPGSGEVNFRYLDDVNRGTMSSSNDNWVLEYDAATKKVQFTENIGPIRTVAFNLDGSQTPLQPGQLEWNIEEDCLNIASSDGSILQAGLEQHMRVKNTTGSTLTNGTVVRFSGVYANSDFNPTVVPHIANGTIPPLYTVGVLTGDIPNGSIGRATTYGKVRELNTTGTPVGETWNIGDILYVSPTNAGKLTKVKPTAPNIVVSVAAVLKVGVTDGILLVRPTIFPRLYYGAFSDTLEQAATVIDTPYAVKLRVTDIANGHHISNNTQIVAENSGLYNYQFSLQFASTNSSAKNVYVWPRKNGVDIPNSATKLTIVGNMVYTVASWNFIVSMNANDYFELMWATTDLSAKIVAPAATTFCPAIPSAIVTVTEAAL